MTEHARTIAIPMDTLDRTTARFRIQPDDYKAATVLELARNEWEDLGMPSVVYATLSPTPPPVMDGEQFQTWYKDPVGDARITRDEWLRLPESERANWVEVP